MATMRVVLDTNVLLSAIAYPASIPGKIMAAWRHGSIEVVLSPYILQELQRVLPRLSHRHGLTDAEIIDLVDVLSILAEIIDPDGQTVMELHDLADQPVIGTFIAAMKKSGADYLISGDKDLLALAGQYPVVTPAEFWATHGSL